MPFPPIRRKRHWGESYPHQPQTEKSLTYPRTACFTREWRAAVEGIPWEGSHQPALEAAPGEREQACSPRHSGRQGKGCRARKQPECRGSPPGRWGLRRDCRTLLFPKTQDLPFRRSGPPGHSRTHSSNLPRPSQQPEAVFSPSPAETHSHIPPFHSPPLPRNSGDKYSRS